jgi:DMSO/TMAO reductase YedYZ molybdopterin-dependent catalytic subunit
VEGISVEELQLAARNHGMPLEALQHDLTPVGLHYLLVHYDIPVVDQDGWCLTVAGRVRRQLELSLEDLRARPAVTQVVTMECAGNGRARLTPRPISQPWLLEAVGNAEWTGVRLAELLDEAGLADDAVELVFTGLDRGVEGGIEQSYERSLTISEARREEVVLAYAFNGLPLPPQHGFPVRLLVPGWYGMASVKWLARITAVAEPFTGYQQARAYRFRQQPDEVGKPVDRIAVRSLMVPPGIPDFLTRRRFLQPGPCTLTGRAWSGHGPITSVDVSTDGGGSWHAAEVGPSAGTYGWHAWTWTWEARSGEHELCSRATDSAGNIQPLTPAWNVGGYAVNAVQRVPALVSAARAA